jgi:predicted nucleotidyltransferase
MQEFLQKWDLMLFFSQDLIMMIKNKEEKIKNLSLFGSLIRKV